MRQLTLLALNKLYVCTALHIEGKIDLSYLPHHKWVLGEKWRAFLRH
jgi:hypothetical protein